jgi:Aconitase B
MKIPAFPNKKEGGFCFGRKELHFFSTTLLEGFWELFPVECDVLKIKNGVKEN